MKLEIISDDLSNEQLLEYWKQMQDESYMAFLDVVALDLPKPAKVKTPLLVLGIARDAVPKQISVASLWTEDVPTTVRFYSE